ncbi:MAG: type IV pilus twitching motility protein PilT [bacterium]
MIDLPAILNVAVQGGASDVHLKPGLPPLFRIRGSLVPARGTARLTGEDLEQVVRSLTDEHQQRDLAENRELDFAFSVPSLGRFRANAFFQRQHVGLVLRVISSEVRSIADLYLPAVLEKIASAPRGLVLVTGATGSGKSTTLAALINHINQTRAAHILTIEDPIEFVFRDRRSIISQREVGDDARSFARALRGALRQDPDVILVGEMRDQETIETALVAAETGHLVLSTLHTTDAPETIDRIINMFPSHQHNQIRQAVANNVHAVLSQRLVRRAGNQGRVAAVEVMISTARIRELLTESGRLHELREAIAAGHRTYGMQTFDQALMALLTSGAITKDEALEHCTNRDDFLLRLGGVQATSSATWDGFEQ